MNQKFCDTCSIGSPLVYILTDHFLLRAHSRNQIRGSTSPTGCATRENLGSDPCHRTEEETVRIHSKRINPTSNYEHNDRLNWFDARRHASSAYKEAVSMTARMDLQRPV